MKRIYNLRLMDTDPAPGGNQPGAQPAAQPAAQPGSAPSFSFAQVEEFAAARADRATKAAIGDFFRKQGMSEDQVTAAIAAYKAEQAAKAPDVDKITKERDEALARVTDLERAAKLREKGVRDADADYVLFKVRGMLEKDEKLDFDKAVDAFLKDNPRFTKAASGYRVNTSTEDAGGKGGGADKSAEVIGALRSAFGRK